MLIASCRFAHFITAYLCQIIRNLLIRTHVEALLERLTDCSVKELPNIYPSFI